MREKISALIKFLTVIGGFLTAFWGICSAYNVYFGTDGVDIATTITWLIVAAIGAGVIFGGILIGNLINR